MFGAVAVMLTSAVVLLGGSADVLMDVGTPPSVTIDLLDIQWWQAVGLFIAGLGLSPAPWILGLATNKIEFTLPAALRHQAAMDAQKDQYENALSEQARHFAELMEIKDTRYSELEKSNAANAAAAETSRARAEEVTDAAFQVVEALRANTHVISSLNEIAREATSP